MCLQLLLGVNFNVHVLCKWRVDIEAETPHGTCTCTYVDESCICRHHVSKDFRILVIRYAVAVKKAWKF